mmetsp:Transcript_2271/g.6088  ORF Transcript_2271/g.6088 Transcript_2271/m.6088 type:complete len:217 (-) Transcript_2271:529-1179(-)
MGRWVKLVVCGGDVLDVVRLLCLLYCPVVSPPSSLLRTVVRRTPTRYWELLSVLNPCRTHVVFRIPPLLLPPPKTSRSLNNCKTFLVRESVVDAGNVVPFTTTLSLALLLVVLISILLFAVGIILLCCLVSSLTNCRNRCRRRITDAEGISHPFPKVFRLVLRLRLPIVLLLWLLLRGCGGCCGIESVACSISILFMSASTESHNSIPYSPFVSWS